MIAVYVLGALLWAVVLAAIVRRIAEQRRAQLTYKAQRAEAERLWWQRESERYELLREMQHVMVLRKLKEWQ